jgi:hypothetical protein
MQKVCARAVFVCGSESVTAAAVHSWDAHGTPFDMNPLTDKFLIY